MIRRSSGKPCGQGKLKQRRNDDQARHQGRSALRQRRDADRDEGAGGTHDEHVPGPDPPDPDRLQNRAHATDHSAAKTVHNR